MKFELRGPQRSNSCLTVQKLAWRPAWLRSDTLCQWGSLLCSPVLLAGFVEVSKGMEDRKVGEMETNK